jgi:hypothetical protein
MFSIKTVLMAAAVSTGVALAVPATSQAMPASGPVKMQTAQNDNLIEVRRKKWRRHHWREGRRWNRHRHHRRYRYNRYRYYDPFYTPYYGYYYQPYPYYYGYYGPRFYGPGIAFSFRF